MPNSRFLKTFTRATYLFVLVELAAFSCLGQTPLWNGNYSSIWGDNRNWTRGLAPNSPITNAAFGQTINPQITFNAATQIHSITFNSDAPAYTFNINFNFFLYGPVTNNSPSTPPLFNLLSSNILNLNNSADMAAAQVAVAANGTIQGNTTVPTSIGALSGSGSVYLGALTLGALGINTTYSGAINGTNGSLTKVGAGRLTLTGTNTYTGPTRVNAGSLYVNGSLSRVSSVTVNSGAVLGGSGSVGDITLSGGTLDPGGAPTAIGTLRASSLFWNSGTLVYDLNTPANSDMLNLSGLLVKGSGTAHQILVNYTGQEGTNTFTLATQAATNFNARDIDVLTGTSGLLLTNALTVNFNSVRLEVTAEPHPVICSATLENPATPTTADFKVCASTSPVAAAQSNSATVNSLLFEDASRLQIGNTVSVTSGAIQSLPGATSSITGGTLTGATGLVFNTDGAAATQTVSSAIAGGSVFSLSKQGAGTLILTGNDTYGGITNVLQGTLDVQNSTALGSSSVDVHAGAIVNVSNGSSLTNALSNENEGVTNFLDTSSAGTSTITNSGALNFNTSASAGNSTITNETGTVTFADNSTAATSTITTNNSARTLLTGSATGGSATVVTNAGGTFDISGLTTGGTAVGSIAGEGSYVLGGNSLTTGSNNTDTTVSGTISGPGGLIKAGSGTLTLSGNNAYTGGTKINSGTLSISDDNNLGDPSGGLVLNGGTLLTTTGITSARAITLNAGGGTINNSGNTDTFSGVIGGSGVLTSAGSGQLILSGNNNYAGGFAVASGTLEIAGTSGDVTGNISDNGTLYFSRRGNYSATGVISGNGSLIKGGGGNLTLIGANTYTGTTRVNAGGLYVNGSLPSNSTVVVNAGTKLGGSGSVGGITLNGATLDPGSAASTAGTLSASSLTWNSGTLLYDLNTPGPSSDQVNLSGALTKGLGGDHNILLNYTGPAARNTFTLITQGSTNFTSNDINVIAGGVGLTTTLSVNPNNVQLVVDAAPLPTDCPMALENPVTPATANFNVCGIVPAAQSGDGTVNSLLFQNSSQLNIGNTVTVTSGAIQNVPNGASSITGGMLTAPLGLAFKTDGTAMQTVSSTIAGGSEFSLNKVGSGTLLLTGNNTYGGTTNVLQGTLDVQGSHALGSSTVDVDLAGTMNVSAGAVLGTNAITDGGTVNFLDTSSAGSSVITNSGLLNFNNSASAGSSMITNASGRVTFADNSNAASSTITTNSDAQTFLTGSATGGSATVITNAGGTFDISGLTTGGTTVGSIAGEGSYVLGANNLTTGSNNTSTVASGVISGDGGLIKVGSGTLTLSGSNSYTGGTMILSGTLSISDDSNLGDTSGALVFGGGTLRTGAAITSERTIALNAGGGTIDNGGHTDTFSGAIGGSGTLTSSGSGALILSGNNSYAGGLAVSNGTLEIAGMNGDVTGNISNNSALIFSRSGNYSATGLISGSGSLTQDGSGNLTLTGNSSSYTGPAAVSGGGLYVNGSIGSDVAVNRATLGGSGRVGHITLNGGSLDPGSALLTAGTLTASSLTWNSGTLLYDLNTPGPSSDQINLSGALTKGSGTNHNILLNYTGPAATNTFTLINQSSTNFVAGDINVIASGAGETYSLVVNPNKVQLVLDFGPVPTNCQTALENPATPTTADFRVCASTSPVPGAQSNNATVNSLLFEDRSNLSLGSNTLSVTSGAIQSITDAASSITGGTLTASGGLAFNTDGTATQTVSSSIAGGGTFSLNKVGSGALVLAGNSTYAGTTNVFEGTLNIESSTALGSSTANVQGAATMNVGSGVILGTNAISNSGGMNFLDGSSAGSSSITNNGSLNFNDSASGGSSTINNNGGTVSFADNSNAGTATITTNGGSTQFAGTASGGSATVVTNANGTFDISALTTSATTVGSIAGEGSYLLGGNALTTGSNNTNTTVGGAISGNGGSLTKVGTGTLTLAGNNTYAGGTAINGGTISISDDNNLGDPSGSLALNGGTLLTTTGITSAREITLNAGGGTINNGGNTDTFSGTIGGSGTLTSSGAGMLTLSGNNSYAGGLAVANGTLLIGGISGDVAGNINNNGALIFDRSSGFIASGVISGNGSLLKEGTGSLTLTGNSSIYTGPTTVNDGGFYVNGSVGSSITVNSGTKIGGSGSVAAITLNQGTLDPGSAPLTAGALNASSLTWNSGNLLYDLNTPGPSSDLLNLSGALTKGSGTDHNILLNYTGPAANNTFTLINQGSTNFVASDINVLATEAGLTYSLAVNQNNVQLVLNAAPTPLSCPATLENPAVATTADFRVCAQTSPVPAAQSNNATVNSLLFEDSSALQITNVVTVTSGAIESPTDATSSIAGGTLTAPTGLAFNTEGTATQTVSSTIAGDSGFSVNKVGSGTLILSGNNSYGGTTNVFAGTLEIQSSNALGSSSAYVQGPATMNVSNGATLGTNGIGNAGTMNFFDTSSAGLSNITNTGSLNFNGSSSAGSSTIANNAGVVTFTDTANGGMSKIATNAQGTTIFSGASSAGSAALTTNQGGTLQFSDNSTAGSSNVTTNAGGTTLFGGTSTGAAAVLTTNGGGLTQIIGSASGGNATAVTNSGGVFDVSGVNGTTTIGSIGGAGSYTLGSNNLTVGSNNTSTTVSGVISGMGGSLTKVGTGTLALTGMNTYTSGTYINGGTLAISSETNLGQVSSSIAFNGGTLQTNAALSSTRNITLNSGGGTINTNGFNSTFGGILAGPGGLMKIGSGVLTLTGANTFAGGTTLVAGTLAVGSAGALGMGDLTNKGGTIHAASRTLAMRVNGNFTQTSGTLSLTLRGDQPGQYDQLLVSGKANLGGTLQVTTTSSFVPRVNDVFAILRASQVSGTFGSLLYSTPGIKFLTDYLTNGVDLRLVPGNYPFGQIDGLTINQRNMANHLDAYVNTGNQFSDDFNSVLLAFGSLDTNAVKDALNQISPQVYEVYKKIAFQEASRRARMISDRLDSVRAATNQENDLPLFAYAQFPELDFGMGSPFGGASLMRGPAGSMQMALGQMLASEAQAPSLAGNSADPTRERAHNWFYGEGTGDFGNFGGTADLAKSTYHAGGFSVGADHRFGDHVAAGLQYAFDRTNADLGHSGNASISSYSPVGYFSVFSKHAYAEAAYAPSYNSYYAVRPIVFESINRVAQSISNGWNQSGEFTTGYDVTRKHWTIGPYARAVYDNFRAQPINEFGAGSLNLMIQKMKAESLRTEGGGRIRGMFKTGDRTVFRPTLEAAWIHESLDDSIPIVSSLSEPGVGSFVVYTERPVRNGFTGRIGLESVVMPSLSFFVNYGIQTGLNNGIIQGLWGGARVWF